LHRLGDILGLSDTLSERMGHISPKQWSLAVGERLARSAQPEQMVEGVLWVRVPSSTWAQELSLLSSAIIERLRASGHTVNQLRYRVASSALPDGRRSLVRPRQASLPPALERAVSAMADRELGQVIAEAAAWSLGRQAEASADERSAARAKSPLGLRLAPGENAKRPRHSE
jgi:hypothetical protein